MIWSPYRPKTRRPRFAAFRHTRLTIDSLEDRFAPASLIPGQSAVIDAPAFGANIVPVQTIAVAAPAPALSSSSAPIGFFHPFSQMGFGGYEVPLEEAPLPEPAPVAPPEVDLVPVPVPAAAIPEPAAPAPVTFERAPMPDRVAEIVPTPRLMPPPTASNAEPVTEPSLQTSALEAGEPASHEFAALGSVAAAVSLLYVHRVRDRAEESWALVRFID